MLAGKSNVGTFCRHLIKRSASIQPYIIIIHAQQSGNPRSSGKKFNSHPGTTRGRTTKPSPNQDGGAGVGATKPSSKFPLLIVVEGYNDMKAVKAAVQADVFVLGTATHAGYDEIYGQLQSAAQKYKGVLLLTDPDVAGRQARNLIDQKLEGCWHAFIPVPTATAAAAIRSKEAGDIGVEHAIPSVIVKALKTARKSDANRTLFNRDQLIEMGLIAPMHERGGKVTERRLLVCDFLGLGPCDGKQLLRQLNRYGFIEQDLLDAIAWAEERIV